MSKLSDLTKNLIQQGYDSQYIKQYLKQYGYSRKDIDQALNEIQFIQPGVTTIKHEHNITKSTLVFLIIGLLIISGLITVFLKLGDVVSSEALLDLAVEPKSFLIEQDSNLKFNIQITNLGDKERFDVTLRYRTLDENGISISSVDETLAVSTSLSKDKTLPVPKELGTYTLKVIASYEGKIASSSFTFDVIEKETEQIEEREIEEEPEEEVEEIKVDFEEIAELAKTQPSQAEQLCLALPNQDDCLSLVVKESRRPEFCDKITSIETRDNCYMSFIVEGQTYLCNKIVIESNKEYCDRISDIQILAKYYQD